MCRRILNQLVIVLTFIATVVAASCPRIAATISELREALSTGSSIVDSAEGPPRWSHYAAPQPQIVVNVASEQDVVTTVQYCNRHQLQFLAQNGGHGWSKTFDLGECGVIINIKKLTNAVFNEQRTEAHIEGGLTVKQMVDLAYANNARFANPTCNCVGFLGATLGGGLTRMAGQYGWSVDQVLSVNVVLASGQMVHASDKNNSDLLWAIRGAAPNFGIVTSAVIKSYPIPQAENSAWFGTVAIPESNLEAVVNAINELQFDRYMQTHLLITTSGAPSFTPSILILPIYFGSTADAERNFAPLLDLSIGSNITRLPYNKLHDFTNPFCEVGGRKPGFSLSSHSLNATSWRAAYESFKVFIKEQGADNVGRSSILVEYFPVPSRFGHSSTGSSFPHHDLPFHTAIFPWYEDASFDTTALSWAATVRGIMREGQEVDNNATYVNFAHGDESNEAIYGASLPRLQALKTQYDPQNRFNQWFPIVT